MAVLQQNNESGKLKESLIFEVPLGWEFIRKCELNCGLTRDGPLPDELMWVSVEELQINRHAGTEFMSVGDPTFVNKASIWTPDVLKANKDAFC